MRLGENDETILKVTCLFVLVAILTTCVKTPIPFSTNFPELTESAGTNLPGIPTFSTDDNKKFREAREELVRSAIEPQGIKNKDILNAMMTVPRHVFVPPEFIDQAYEDHALPIGFGQSISQPYVVAWMTELLELKPGEKVLEIGTGSGYQAAILAELGFVEVYTIEIIPALADSAETRFHSLGYIQIHTTQGDGYYGWTEYAPYDAIIVTAAPDHLPAPLVEQLTDSGRIVIPIGPPGWGQILWKFVKEKGELKAYRIGVVGFVPFTGEGIRNVTPTP